MSGIILGVIWSTIWGFIQAFWGWLVIGASALLGLMFSPTLRKYTIAAIVLAVMLGAAYIGGYASNHNVTVETHQCSEFQKHLVSGPATDKALRIFKRNGLCT